MYTIEAGVQEVKSGWGEGGGGGGGGVVGDSIWRQNFVPNNFHKCDLSQWDYRKNPKNWDT